LFPAVVPAVFFYLKYFLLWYQRGSVNDKPTPTV